MNTEETTQKKTRFEIAFTLDDMLEIAMLAKLDKRSPKNYIELIVEKHLQKIRNKKPKT